MNARFAIAAMLALTACGTSFGQGFPTDPNTGRPYAGTISTTTVTTYAPAYRDTGDQDNTYRSTGYQDTTANVSQTTYAPVYTVPLVPTTAPAVNYGANPSPAYAPQPAAEPVMAMSFSALNSSAPTNLVHEVNYHGGYPDWHDHHEHYEHYDHFRPVYYSPVARPYYAPVARPGVPYYPPVYPTAYAPVSYGAPIGPAPIGPPPAANVPGGPRVWVHPKVYVEGEPVRNLIKAVTP